MNIKEINLIKYSIPLSVVGFFAWLHQIYVTHARPDAVYMDSLRLVYQLEQWRRGHLSFLHLWGLGGQHQGFVNQLLLLLNVKYFSYDVLLANRMTGIVVAILVMVIIVAFNLGARESREKLYAVPITVRIGVSALIAMICFSWANFELFTLDLGLPLWIKNLSFVTYFAVHAYYLRLPARGKHIRTVGLGLALVGPVIVLMIGMGWSYSFVAAVLAVSSLAVVESIKNHDVRAPFLKFIPAITLLLAQIVYLLASMSGGGAAAAPGRFSTLLHVPELLLYALGSGLIGVETIANYPVLFHVLPYISGGAVAVAVVLLFARFGRELYSGSLLPAYLLAYGFLTALSVSVARGGEGVAAVMASRYYMDIMFFFVGLVWLWYDSLEGSLASWSYVSMTLFLTLCFVIFVGQSLTYRKEWASAPYRSVAFKSMNQALLEGVPDQKAAILLQSPLDDARKGDQVLLEHHLALYSSLPESVCATDSIEYLGGWYGREPQGVWMGRAAVMKIPACHCDFVASVYLPSNFPARVMSVFSSGSEQVIHLESGKVEQLHMSRSSVPRTVNISVTATTIPLDLPNGVHDVRELGVLWTENTFACSGHASN